MDKALIDVLQEKQEPRASLFVLCYYILGTAVYSDQNGETKQVLLINQDLDMGLQFVNEGMPPAP